MVRSCNSYIEVTTLATGKYHDQEINVCPAFQRGSEHKGIWTKTEKRKYIQSLLQNFPTGILVLVKSTGSNKFDVLDGANRFRAIRDYKQDKFEVEYDNNNNKKMSNFKNLDAETRAQFNNMHIPVQFITIENTDPASIISEMFINLNVSAKSLVAGELLNAHGYRGDCCEIELAKALINEMKVHDESPFNFTSYNLDAIKINWAKAMGQLCALPRYQNMSMMIALIISAKTSTYAHFDNKYETQINHFQDRGIDFDFTEVIKKLNQFIDIMNKLKVMHAPKVMGKITKGMPIKKNISAIWKTICENEMDEQMEQKFIEFYTVKFKSQEIHDEYKEILNRGGDSRATTTKIQVVIDFIKKKTTTDVEEKEPSSFEQLD